MKNIYNIYCDESCHLQNDKIGVMVLGAVWCSKENVKEINHRIKEIKARHEIKENSEIKWNKIYKGKVDFYDDLIDYFFDNDDLHFRGLIVPDKSKLKHKEFNQTHNDFYYKMMFDMLKIIFAPHDSYNIYLDIKDTQSQSKVVKLKEILRTSQYDFSKQIINRVQQIRSHEINIIQLTDIFCGALAYHHRKLTTSAAKLSLIRRIQERSGYALDHSTLFRETKFNIFIWRARG